MTLGTVDGSLAAENWLVEEIIELGARPAYLVNDMDEGPLKATLKQCNTNHFDRSDFSIGHRGAPLGYPEHTVESYQAAAKMGAGIVECDVTFTKDQQLVCRHSQCDLHRTTNILLTPLASKCSIPFSPADQQDGGEATVKCCSSDITLEEFKTLKGRADKVNSQAASVEEYLNPTSSASMHQRVAQGTLLTHAESIALLRDLEVKFIPELKSPQVDMPYQGHYSQSDYAQQMIDEYVDAGVAPTQVWPQSFNFDDVQYWIDQKPEYGKQAVFLENRVYTEPEFSPSSDDFQSMVARGLNIIAVPTFALVKIGEDGEIVASTYAKLAKQAGLKIMAWTVERSGSLRSGGGFYYSSLSSRINNDGDVFDLIDALANEVGVIGIFSDWPATTTYYANCMGLQ